MPRSNSTSGRRWRLGKDHSGHVAAWHGLCTTFRSRRIRRAPRKTGGVLTRRKEGGDMNQQISPGRPVYDARGEVVGMVGEQGATGQYFVVYTPLYLPLAAIQGPDPAGGVHLALPREELAQR